MAIDQSQADQLQAAYQSGSPDLQSMASNMGVTQADVAQYFPGFDTASAGLNIPAAPTPTPAPAAPTPTPAPAAPTPTPTPTPTLSTLDSTGYAPPPVSSTPVTTDQIQQYVTGIMNDPNLNQFQKENNIIQAANANNVSMGTLGGIFGASNVLNGLSDYKTQMTNYINNAITSNPEDGMAQTAAITNAANANGLNAADVAKTTGMNQAAIQGIFDNYSKGVSNIATSLTAPNVTDAQKMAGALQAQNQYGITDAQYANALGMKTGDVTNYLDPARNFQSSLKTLSANPNAATSSQVQDLLNQAQNNPTVASLFSGVLPQLQTVLPNLQFSEAFKNAQSGTGSASDILGNYQQMQTLAQNNPALAQQFAPQLQQINQLMQMSSGGKNLSTFETFSGLDKNMLSQAPTALPTKTVPYNYVDENGNYVKGTTQEVQQPEGVTANQDDNGVTYSKQVTTPAGWDPKVQVYAQYDANGTLTGYKASQPVFPTDASGNPIDNGKVKYWGEWDANGNAKPQVDTSHGGQVSNLMQEMGPMAGIGLGALATYLSGGLAAPLTSSLGATAGSALASGIVGGGLAGLTGGNIAQGFFAGGLGNLAGSTVGNALKGVDTGLGATANNFVSTALPRAATAATTAAIGNPANIGNAILGSLGGSALNTAANSLLPQGTPSTLTSALSTVLPKILQGAPLNQFDLMNAVMAADKASAKPTGSTT